MLAMMMEASQHMSSLIRSLWFSLLPLVILAYHVFSYFLHTASVLVSDIQFCNNTVLLPASLRPVML